MSDPLLPLALSKGTRIHPISSHVYSGTVSPDFCYASAHALPTANGGYIASMILEAIKQHFTTGPAAPLHQPDTYTIHFRFLEANNAGPIRITIADVKPGKNTSTVHFSTRQNRDSDSDSDYSRETIVGYATNFNISTRKGTGFTIPIPPSSPLLSPPLLPIDFSRLTTGTDPHWIAHSTPYTPTHTIKSQTQCLYTLPRTGHPSPTITDTWISPIQPGERWTNASLGWVCDQWPQGVAAYRPQPLPLPPSSPRPDNGYGLMNTPRGIWGAAMWYPTLTMDVEMKKSLPAEGTEWLFVRARARLIKDGRMDLEVMVFDSEMELVALSHHVCFVISLAPKGKGEGKEKL